SINRERGEWSAAISDYKQAVTISENTDNYRGVTDAGGLLAQAYEHTGDLPAALGAIDTAIAANTHIADELYLVPRNLAIKAEITEKMGHAQEADGLYRKSIALVEALQTLEKVRGRIETEALERRTDHWASSNRMRSSLGIC
ncbi:hypothetical protein, partial [Edaphobacter aggregans]|uniref:hypothetical protein n=1 Tax=Edaphobacter aggregans TaxID=570835 RepID=UPI000551E6E3